MSATQTEVSYDPGLRSYLTSIYNWMFVGLLVSAATSYFSISTGLVASLAHGGVLFWIVALVPFVLIFMMAGLTASTSSMGALVAAFAAFTALEGMSLSVVLVHYTGASVATAFVATAAAFAALSLYGYTTKRNLTGLGTFFFVALIGLIVALVLSIVLHSAVFTALVSAAGVLIFAGLVAYDTQTMRAAYTPGADAANARMAIWSALDLYLDFLNLFLFLLRFVGVSSDD